MGGMVILILESWEEKEGLELEGAFMRMYIFRDAKGGLEQVRGG
jgi:hypothetical protein